MFVQGMIMGRSEDNRNLGQQGRVSTRGLRRLTPEEDVIDAVEAADDEIDDTLPADLWYRSAGRSGHRTGR